MLMTSKKILDKARKGKYGVGAFNFVNMEMLQAIIQAANEEKSPVIVQTSEGAIKYMGDAYLKGFVKAIKETAKVPIALHLDHGLSAEMVKKAISLGYTSVMIDGSKFTYDENIKVTKEVVRIAHSKGASVEAELGTIGGAEDNVESKKIIYTDPSQAADFVKKTKCDTLAVAIGTSHGAYKFKGETKLNYDIVDKIMAKVKVPLVLHGASSIPADAIDRINKYGGKLEETHGVDDESLKKAISHGISKVNTDSDLRLIWTGTVREVLASKPEEFDLRKIIGPAKDNLVAYVKRRMQIMGSSGKA